MGRDVAEIRVDPTYRPRGAERRLAGGAIAPDALLVSWRLEDPGRTLREAAGLEARAAQVGEVSVVDAKRAGDCVFYRRLPTLPSSPQVRWLAPAVSVEAFLGRMKGASGAWPVPAGLPVP